MERKKAISQNSNNTLSPKPSTNRQQMEGLEALKARLQHLEQTNQNLQSTLKPKRNTNQSNGTTQTFPTDTNSTRTKQNFFVPPP